MPILARSLSVGTAVIAVGLVLSAVAGARSSLIPSRADLPALIPPAGVATVPDCNSNGVDDASDIASGASGDVNNDGVPDECEVVDTCESAGERVGSGE